MSDPATSGSPETPGTGRTGADAADPSGDARPGGSAKRRRGSRGGRNRNKPKSPTNDSSTNETSSADPSSSAGDDQPSSDDAPRKPKIGDSRPAPVAESDRSDEGSARNQGGSSGSGGSGSSGSGNRRRRRRGGRGRGSGGGGGGQGGQNRQGSSQGQSQGGGRNGGRQGGRGEPVEAVLSDEEPVELDAATLKRRRGRERNGRPVGRYMMAVSTRGATTQIAVLEGRTLIEHYVSRPADNDTQIHGNIYLGKVQNVLPGMEAAFIDIGTPKNAVLYRGDVQFDPDDVEEKGQSPKIEELLKARQSIICQVTKNPIAHKGARLTQEVSLPGRFVVLIPNSSTYGISKRLPDNERKRLRAILDKVRPPGHGIIVRTAAENVTAEEIERDVARLSTQWEQIAALAERSQAPSLLYKEPDMAVRVIREEFNKDYRSIVIDDRALYEEVADYVTAISPALADRVQFYDTDAEQLPLFERHHVHEQLHKALDRKVWLPSGGSLIIEHTEALTVIDVNTGKNVGTSSLEETVYRNNLEAAEEIARQLRLRDIGGIIVIDFVDMEVRSNRDDVTRVFREALARDKTRTQVFEISELGLVEMTRKRIGEGLLESLAHKCPECDGRGLVVDTALIDD
ncbi:Rne/Rng family ribonuclease [Actinomarinicola tropica]|uniref:Rne/Rng family ribonuclease n=1 Tax=Actinomarinicola tropica TaxID=2789776 RepID=A0A5Q2RL96_9ACTN|nr:Rne/Rng family ribonuclease [Actinomarinicola tropica]QGG95702.1 Rne/Rng family ribonuclease [Actinomarinicola tropica]